MTLYLPIAELSMNIFFVIGMGAIVGFLSGMFGVGGGFLMTPILIFSGVPPLIAVSTESNEITAASVSGVIGHWRRNGVDVKMGGMLVAGGGVEVLSLLESIGQSELIIKLAYFFFLGTVGSLMFWESMRSIYRQRTGYVPPPINREDRHKAWIHTLPFKMRFRKSRLYISALLPIGIGFVVGILSGIMGVGGGFIMVPAMIYILGMPTNVVVGTSLFQIIFVTAVVTINQSVSNQSVDVLLAVLLLLGAVIGAQFGVRAGAKLKGEQLRGLLALMVVLVGIKFGYDLVVEPTTLHSVATVANAGGH
jgi:uncharacterized membrane protein YfcA